MDNCKNRPCFFGSSPFDNMLNVNAKSLNIWIDSHRHDAQSETGGVLFQSHEILRHFFKSQFKLVNRCLPWSESVLVPELFQRDSTTPLRNIGVHVCLGSLVVLGQVRFSAEDGLGTPAELFSREWNLPRLLFRHSRHKFIWQRVIPVNLFLRSGLNSDQNFFRR
jgi:hypothetical protein